MEKALPTRWDLDVFFAGGSSSESFSAELDTLTREIARLADETAGRTGTATDEQLLMWTAAVQSILERLREAESFVSCLLAEQMKDSGAARLNHRVQTLAAEFGRALTSFDDALRQLPDAAWEAWVRQPQLADAAFYLTERRELARMKLPPAQEALVSSLAVDGYHGWGELYNTIVSGARFVSPPEAGESKELSAGQMHNLLSHPDRAVRAAAFDEWERVWGEQSVLCADALNRLAGFRLQLYKQRGWASVLQEPLQMNRMSEAVLSAMWSAIDESKSELTAYLERKARLLGMERLDWHDVEAPIGQADKTIGYEEAASFIIQRFRAFDPQMADFAELAFRDGWIEAEDRPGKRPGGFCTSFPKTGQTRIFMTYSGTASNVATLAHELGHAYHQHVMNDLPPMAQEYAMNVAETASTFAELIVADSAMQEAADPQEKLVLLEDKIQRTVAFYMNIYARFRFETAFYERRAEGTLSADELNALMEEAQEEAFGGAIGRKHPAFWASKLHFYLTDVPFYNFPYTFGYLFSTGLYARALEEGSSFAGRYVELLRDTGRMNVEELAQKHLGVSLEQPDFWRSAVALTVRDIHTFLEMTE
ncbi:M3 family oligoendopeptidase [Paenibacillus sp. 1P07SE]|uniref:M3 family oligoendopeptidase n=1 Tax=Paenibacillus sp. 1P07SE TaxID=3132209 RepID=UPI0039A69A3C